MTISTPASNGVTKLKAIFECRKRGAAGTYEYLGKVYACLRARGATRAFRKAVDAELDRSPHTDNLFADVIEVTSDYSPKLRWKYANLLQLMSEHGVPSMRFEQFIKKRGGFNATIEALKDADSAQ